jgi:hypothetical protein
MGRKTVVKSVIWVVVEVASYSAHLVNAGIVPVPSAGDDCGLFDRPDDRLDPIEQFAHQLILTVSS